MTVDLRLSDTIFRGWQSVAVHVGLDQVAGTFDLSLTERWAITRRPIRQGEPCSVSLDGEPVIKGHIDTVSPSYDANTHSISVAGRDATGDLVDCAVLPVGKRWQNTKLDVIARDICKPFGINVLVLADVGAPIKEHAAEPGESAFDCLERAARYRGVLLRSDALGYLILSTPGKQRISTRLALGRNILSAAGSGTFLERYREYLVVAQLARGDDATTPAQAAGALGRAVDGVVQRYRPRVIVAEDQADNTGCQARADYQRAVSAARGNEITYTLNGWRDDAGALWQPNRLARVDDDYMGIHTDWLITRVAYLLDERGERVELTMMPPSAYDLRAVPEPEAEANQ